MSRKLSWMMWSAVAAGAIAACTADLGASDPPETGAGGGGGGDGGATTSSTMATGGEGGEGGQLVLPEEEEAAAGISVADIYMNQGVGTMVVDDGQPLQSDAWSVPLIAGRPMLVRATWDLDDSFAQREVRGVLVLHHADDTIEVVESVRTIAGPPDLTTIEGTFVWDLTAEQVSGGMTFSLHILDHDAATSDPEDVLAYRYPAAGEQSLDLITDAMELDYVVVPISTDCEPAPVFEDKDKEELEAYMFNLYPIQRLNITYHAPLAITGCGSGDVMSELATLRESEGMGPQSYYQGIFTAEGDSGGGFAWVVGDGPGADRTGYAVWWRNEIGDKWGGIDNAAHEIGHNHGQGHTWNDAAYEPAVGADDGGRDHFGFGLRGGLHPAWGRGDMNRLYLPSVGDHATTDGGEIFGDVLSYDFPYWVSAYTYRMFAERVRAVTALGVSNVRGGADDRSRKSMHGQLLADGSIRWTLQSGHPELARASFGTARGVVGSKEVALDVSLKRGCDDRTRGVVIPLPADRPVASFDRVMVALDNGVTGTIVPARLMR